MFNQSFCGNDFHKGQYYSYNNYNLPPHNSSLPPDIVGEGEVTSILLPDGTCQYFFTPTMKWTPTNSSTPHYVNPINTNYNNAYYNVDLGVWFIRSINNPTPAYITNSYLRNRSLMPALSSDYNLNPLYPGYQLKFHNDKCTSTTDIHYFYPCLRQYDCTFNFPARACAAVQIDTPITKTACHCEVLCSKHCHCKAMLHLPKPPSAMSLTDNYQTKEIICQNMCKSQSSYTDMQQRELIPSDIKNKRIQIQKKPSQSRRSKDVICQCSTNYYDKSTVTYTDSGNGSSNMDINTKTQSNLSQRRLRYECGGKAAKSESKDCRCCPPRSLNNCTSTSMDIPYIDEDYREMKGDECCQQTSNVINAHALINDSIDTFETEIWYPKSASSKKIFQHV